MDRAVFWGKLQTRHAPQANTLPKAFRLYGKAVEFVSQREQCIVCGKAVATRLSMSECWEPLGVICGPEL